ncbi:hypothetical protein PGB90_010479 [Kerria lacca]
MISTKELVKNLLIVSEKAARIVRICRQDEHLLSLLIEEKTDNNLRFTRDFKTLADVLVQEVIKYDIGKQFPTLKNFIYGEESNKFTNVLGESVIITLNDCKVNTGNLLYKVLNGDERAVNALTEAVHSSILLNEVPVNILPADSIDIPAHDIAIWIDPIDSTAEYINGGSDNCEAILDYKGLPCVTVLIGLFSRSTGSSMIGVINQPFFKNVNEKWLGRCFWGVSIKDFNFSSVSPIATVRCEKFIAISACESYHNKQKLEEAGFKLITPAGAGYKILCVILNLIDAYVLTKGTTFYWDTCCCHAIIKAQKGNIWNFENSLRGNFVEILYTEKSESDTNIEEYRNKAGYIVCKDENLVFLLELPNT